jgi:4-amino-4-deoxy-L-arabinose transferase-like glycosyltransferase
MSATLFCFILGVRESAGARRRWLFYGLYASAALATLTKGLIGFLVTGAVMFLWLLLFNQWKRLRPLHLPTGILVFLAIAAPWHVLAAQRNPGWARFYFIHEHWERFTTTEHARYEPWWYFIPVVLLGIFPWTGFLWSATRDVFARGWARRTENAETWFFLTWAGFVFLFFSKSQSKLIPYMLPVMPPLAVIIGGWLASRLAARAGERLKAGLRIFGFFAGLFAIALLAAAFKPGAIRDAQQASAVRPFAIAGAVIFLVGGVAAPWLARLRGPRAALTAMAATAAAFYLVLLAAAPSFQRAGTKDLALVARERIAPGDRVFHYWAFFHDFVYYTERPVGLVGYLDELEVQFVDPAERRARFIDDADLRRLWAESQRVWLVVRKRDQQAPKSVFTDPAFHYHLIAESRTHSLVSNQP